MVGCALSAEVFSETCSAAPAFVLSRGERKKNLNIHSPWG